MKNQWIIIRIVLALVAIFAIGIWVGRVTAPEFAMQPLEVTIDEADEADQVVLKRVVLRAMTKYRTDLDLTNEQVRILRPEFVATSRRMQVLPRTAKARLPVLEDFHAKIAEHLTEEQKVKLAEIMKKAEQRERSE